MLGAAAEVEAPRADERRTLKMILGIDSQSSASFQLGRCCGWPTDRRPKAQLVLGAALPCQRNRLRGDPRNAVRLVFGSGHLLSRAPGDPGGGRTPWGVIPDKPESRNAEAAFRRPRALLTKQQGD